MCVHYEENIFGEGIFCRALKKTIVCLLGYFPLFHSPQLDLSLGGKLFFISLRFAASQPHGVETEKFFTHSMNKKGNKNNSSNGGQTSNTPASVMASWWLYKISHPWPRASKPTGDQMEMHAKTTNRVCLPKDARKRNAKLLPECGGKTKHGTTPSCRFSSGSRVGGRIFHNSIMHSRPMTRKMHPTMTSQARVLTRAMSQPFNIWFSSHFHVSHPSDCSHRVNMQLLRRTFPSQKKGFQVLCGTTSMVA